MRILYTRIQHRRPISVLRCQKHQWLRFRHHSIFLSGLSFLLPLRHGLGFVNWFEMAAGKDRKTHNVEQTEKVVPFITSEVAFGQQVSELVFWSIYFIWILGSKLILSNNQSNATLWVLDACLIIGLLPFMIILISASLSSNTYNKASWREDWTFEGTLSILFRTLIFPWDFCLLSVCLHKRYNGASHWEELSFVATWSRFDNCSTFWLPLSFKLVFGMCTWCCDHASCLQLPLLMISRYSMNVTLVSPHPINQEEGYHPFAN